ncbi:MAG: PfkB family carbohydrate kinase [Candidatus Thorarchaeota archaeon]|jgi:rfaE bifunctional protein kinase chain/domain
MKKIGDVNVLVVGDIMLDKYIIGEVERISPEAPVPIVKAKRKTFTLGGCGNVVRNIREIGANVSCLSSIMQDEAGKVITEKLKDIEVEDLLTDSSLVTTVKERVIASERQIQMLRIDHEINEKINHLDLINFLQNSKVKRFDTIVVSDYAKGVVSKGLMEHLRSLNSPIIVDPKPENFKIYGKVFMFTPNEKEWNNIKQSESFFSMGSKYILITKGRTGMELRDFNQHWEIPAPEVHQIYNVSGAGDTVIAIMSTCLSLGFNPLESAKIANKCAGYVVTQPGTSIIPKEIFNKFIHEVK